MKIVINLEKEMRPLKELVDNLDSMTDSEVAQSLIRMRKRQEAKKEATKKHRATIWADIQATDPDLAEFIKEARAVFGTTLVSWRGERL